MLSLGTLSSAGDVLDFLLIMCFGGVFVRYWERMNLGAASHLPSLNLFFFLFKPLVSVYFIRCVICGFIHGLPYNSLTMAQTTLIIFI